MTKSGNAAIRLFLTLMTEPISDIRVLGSTSMLISGPPLAADHTVSSGHTDVDRGHRLLRPEYIPVSPFGFGFLR